MEEQVGHIQKKLEVAQNRQKSYVDAHGTNKFFELGDQVFICIRPKKKHISIWIRDEVVTLVYRTFQNQGED